MARPDIDGPLIARTAGTTPQDVYRIVNGRAKLVGPQIAGALMQTTAHICLARGAARGRDRHARTSSTGVARRLQALAADGWDSSVLAALSGFSVDRLGHLRIGLHTTVRASTHERIKELYDKIQSQADPSGSSPETARRALRRGYLLPERWADEDIDNPDAQPLPPPPDTEDHVAVTRLIEDCLHQPEAGRAANLPREVKKELARHARHRLGWSWDQLAWLLGYKGASTAQYLVEGRAGRGPKRKRAGAARRPAAEQQGGMCE
jgi:hypothetical protein